MSYEEAAAHLGQDFRLPTVHLDGFVVQPFQLSRQGAYFTDEYGESIWRYEDDEYWHSFGSWWHPRWVRIFFDNWQGHGSLRIDIETVRAENTRPWQEIIPDGEITSFVVDGVTVYKISAPDRFVRYIWTHDDLVYTLYPPSELGYPPPDVFSTQQIHDIIRSMVE